MDTLRLPAELASLEVFVEFVLERMRRSNLGGEKVLKVRLALEEALVNVINYAYPEGDGRLEVGCSVENEGRLELFIRDWGPPFNPLARGDPDLTEDIMKRPIGGLGIYLVRQMVDEVHYVREKDGNLLTLAFNVQSEQARI